MNNVSDKDKTQVGKIIYFNAAFQFQYCNLTGIHTIFSHFIFVRTIKMSKQKCLFITDKFEILNEVYKRVKKRYC